MQGRNEAMHATLAGLKAKDQAITSRPLAARRPLHALHAARAAHRTPRAAKACTCHFPLQHSRTLRRLRHARSRRWRQAKAAATLVFFAESGGK